MKILITILILVLVGLQYKLWFGDGSLSEVVQLTHELELQKQRLKELEARNVDPEVVALSKEIGKWYENGVTGPEQGFEIVPDFAPPAAAPSEGSAGP